MSNHELSNIALAMLKLQAEVAQLMELLPASAVSEAYALKMERDAEEYIAHGLPHNKEERYDLSR